MRKNCTWFLLIVLFFVWGCSKVETPEEQLSRVCVATLHNIQDETDGTRPTLELDMAALAQCGYDTTCVIEYEDYYRVGTDLIFEKSYIKKFRESHQARLIYERTLSSDYQRIHITGSCYEYNDKDYIIDAAKAWNELEECNLNFTTSYDTNGEKNKAPLTVEITPFTIFKELLTVTNPPMNYQSATHLTIYSDHQLWKEISKDQKKYLLMHGLGHVVGLGDYNPNSFGDMFSIMQPESELEKNKELWNGFSPDDRINLRQKYPLIVIPDEPQFEISSKPALAGADEDKLVVGTQYTFTADYTNPAVPNPVYAFSVEKLDNQVRYEFKAGAGNTCTLKITTPGKLRLKVKIVHNGAEKNVYQRYYSGYINKFEHPSKPELETFYDFKWNFWDVDYPDYTVNFWVEEKYFDQGSDISTTIERVDNGHVRIRFNEYGGYKVVAELRTGPHLIERKEYFFTKLLKLSGSLSRQSTTSGSYTLPEYPNGPTGLHPLQTEIWNIKFGNGAPLEGRVICNVHKFAQQHALDNRRRIDRSTVDRGYVTVRIPKGATVYELPPIYHMYDPEYENYAFHYKFLWEYYSGITYPND